MKNYKTNDNSLFNYMALEMDSVEANYKFEQQCIEACERFLHSASQLKKGGMLGWQILLSPDGAIRCHAYADRDSKVTAADYNWIFRGCAKVSTEADDGANGQKGMVWKEYRLVSVLGSNADITEVVRSNSRSRYDDFDDYRIESVFAEAFRMLSEAGAVVRICAWNSEQTEGGHGNIFLSLPAEMPLRLRSAFSVALPHLKVTEEDENSSENVEEAFLPDEYFLNGAARFLYMLCGRKKPAEEDVEASSDSSGEDFEIDDDTAGENGGEDEKEISIDELDLSVSAYNALVRSGINTVGKLRDLPDEKLKRIRGLRRSTYEEIQQKLADFIAISEEAGKTGHMKELEELIGLKNVKEQVKRIVAFAKMKMDMKERGEKALPIALNMEFAGNPGTAKTTVGRIVAGIFHEIGLLDRGGLIEVGRADLVAEYVGQTAPAVRRVFQRAKGRVLLIDEAYSLVEQWENGFGDEAISTIVQEMENHRDETIVIFAGYPDKMREFFARNPGLRSRVPFTVNFRDYTADELAQIVSFEAERRGFAVSTEAVEKVRNICESVSGMEDSGNGRFCRNLVENAILNYAVRVYGEEGESGKDFTFAASDFEVLETNKKEKKARNPLGFLVS